MIRTYFVDGDKGGVGKSMVARAVVDMLIQSERFLMPPVDRLFIIDADPTNMDVCCPGGFVNETIGKTQIIAIQHPIRFVDDWYSIISRLDEADAGNKSENNRVVFSLPAAAGLVLAENTDVFEMMEAFNGFPVWVLGNERSSVAQLEKRIEAAQHRYAQGFVVRNLKHGVAASFSYWNNSETRKNVLAWGWQEIDFPVLASSIAIEVDHVPSHVVERDKINANGTRAMLGTQIAITGYRSVCGNRLKVLETAFAGEVSDE